MKTRLKTGVFATLCGAFLVVCAVTIWRGEEPSRFRTLLVAFFAYGIGATGLFLARKMGWIGSYSLWVVLLGLKFVLSIFLTYFAWFEPRWPELLRMPNVLPGAQDSNLYDYYAVRVAENGFLNSWEHRAI